MIPIQTTPPSNPSNGDYYIDSSTNNMYVYDSIRGKWLSTTMVNFGGGKNRTQSTGYLRMFNGCAMSDTTGFVSPWNGTIIGMGIGRDDTNSCTIQVRRNGATSGAQLSSSTYRTSVNNLNIDFSADETLSLYLSSGIATNPQCWVFIKWRV